MTLTFNPLRAIVVAYPHAKVQDQGQSVPKMKWKQTDVRTDGRTEVSALPPSLMRSVMIASIVVKFELFELYYWLELYELYYKKNCSS